MSLRLIRDAAIDLSLSPHLYSFFFYLLSFSYLLTMRTLSAEQRKWGGACNLSHSLANLLSAITPTNQVEVFEGLSFFFAPIRWCSRKKKKKPESNWMVHNEYQNSRCNCFWIIRRRTGREKRQSLVSEKCPIRGKECCASDKGTGLCLLDGLITPEAHAGARIDT